MSAPSRKQLGDLLLEMSFISKEQQDWLVAAQSQMLKRSGNGASGAPSGTGGTTTFPAQKAAAGAARAKSSQSPLAPASTPAPVPPTPAPAKVEAPERTQIVPASKLPTLEQILTRAAEAKASDVHIHAGAPLQMRVGGVLKELKVGVINAGSTQPLLMSALTDEQRANLEKNKDLDFALQLKCGRFRVNFYKQQRGWDGVFRPIPPKPPSLSELGLPKTLERLTQWHQGLVLITGPAGCGKSSTLAALVDLINKSRHEHIITVEDPIEFIHPSKSCVVNQRQAGTHTLSFANALRAALREDPDVIVIGELRDLETISLAITAAETGHLVLATLHTNSAIRTINRILDVFPPKQQSQVRAMVSESLKAIVSQRLVPTPDGTRRVPALEVLFVKPSVSNLIRDEKTFQIRSVMQTGKADGMAVLDDALADLVKAGTINKQTARRYAEDPKRFT
jgi:twitching motility protein PilT